MGGIEILLEPRDASVLDGDDQAGRHAERCPVAQRAGQSVLLHIAAREGVTAGDLVLAVLETLFDPAQDAKVLGRSLLLAVVVVPDAHVGRVAGRDGLGVAVLYGMHEAVGARTWRVP